MEGFQRKPSVSFKKIFVGLWLGKNGVLFGFRDEGKFFEEQSTKKLVESRTDLPSTKENPSGLGMMHIYEADRVCVSTKENTLYLAILYKSMVYNRRR